MGDEEIKTPATPAQQLRSLLILIIALMAGCLLFWSLFFFISFLMGPAIKIDRSAGYTVEIVAAAIAALCFLIAWKNYNKSISSFRDDSSGIDGKMKAYYPVFIRYLALLEFPSLLCVIGFYLFHDYVLLIITALLLVAMMLKFPGRDRLSADLALDSQEQTELE